MTWNRGRQLFFITIFVAIVLIILVPLVIKLWPEESCFDGKKNQDERGVDCGGLCKKACTIDTLPASALWARPFKVSEGMYSVVAFVNNPNSTYEALAVPYRIRLFDEKGIAVGERTGTIDIPARKSFPIFQGGIYSGNNNAVTADFNFTKSPEWVRAENDRTVPITVSNTNVSEEGSPRITATLTNTSLEIMRNIAAVVVVYNENENAIAASETLIERFPPQESTEVVYTWPEDWSAKSARVEIYPQRFDK